MPPKFSSTPQTDCDTALQIGTALCRIICLATCWNGLIQGQLQVIIEKDLQSSLNFSKIPGENKCYAAMTIGYPSVSLHSIPERKVDITMINGHN